MTEMIDNYCTQENDVYGESADKDLSDLSEEQLRDVLEQLTDHNLPDSEKCPLVRRLNAENASKEESDLVITRLCKSSIPSNTSNTYRTNRKSRHLQRTGSKDAEYTGAKERTNGSKAVHSSQSLQDLMSSANNSDYDLNAMRAIGANSYRSGKRLNKAGRANSFTMPSGSSQHFSNNNINTNKEGFSELLSSADSRTSSQTQTQSSLPKGIRNKSVKSRPTQHISTPNSAKSDDESAVSDNPSLSSRPTLRECFATQSVHTDNHNMDSCDNNNCSNPCNSSAPAVEAQVCEIEMKEMGQRVEFIEYSRDLDINSDSQHKSYNNVDSFLDYGLRTVDSKEAIKTGFAERVINHNYDYESEDNRLMQFQGSESSKAYEQTYPYQGSDLANYQPIQQPFRESQPSRNVINTRDKKKKKAESSVLSQNIEGHIGFKDVEYLEAFVNSSANDSSAKQTPEVNSKNGSVLMTNSSVKESVKKKDKSIQMLVNSVSKRKNGSNTSSPNQSASAHKSSPNIPLSTSSSSFSSDENNSVVKHSDFAQTTETTSPLNSSSDRQHKTPLTREDSDTLDDDKPSTDPTISAINCSSFSLMSSNISAELLYTASDSEMADREKGFVTPSTRKRRKGLLRRMNNQRNQKSMSMQSSTSTTPSSSTVSGPVGGYERYSGMRGYESEREYTEDYRRKNCSVGGRRKSLSSVAHSEQNSAYNSDGELSSHSMPIRNDSMNTEKSTSESRTSSSISSTPKASYADIAKTLNFGINFAKRSSLDTNATIGSLLEQYQEFPQLDLSLTPVVDLSTPSSPSSSKIIEALVSPQPKGMSEKRETSASNSAPTSTSNTPLPQTVPQNECLLNELSVNKSNTGVTATDEASDGSSVPAVIMCDYTESVPLNDIGSVTFGFFDDVGADQTDCGQTPNQMNCVADTDLKTKSPIKTSPEARRHANSPKVRALEMSYSDVDKKSFNYEHIIGFIKKTWDSAKRDFHYECYESSPTVK